MKDLLLSLAAFQASPPTPPRVPDLLQALLARARNSLVQYWETKNFEATELWLDLADSIAIKAQAAPLLDLLRFYYSTFAPKSVLVKLDANALASALWHLANALTACDKDVTNQDITAEVRKNVINASSIFFEVIPSLTSIC